MQLFWSPISPFVRKVMVVAHELDKVGDLSLNSAKVFPFHIDETVAAINPLVRIPTLVTDDGAMLYGSHVICEYLDQLDSGGKIIPETGNKRIEALKIEAIADGLIEILMFWLGLSWSFEGEKIETLTRVSRLKLQKTLDYLDEWAVNYPDSEFDIAGISVAAALGYLDFRFSNEEWRSGRPALSEWFGRISERPSMLATVPRG